MFIHGIYKAVNGISPLAFNLCGLYTTNGTSFVVVEETASDSHYIKDGVLFSREINENNMVANRRKFEKYSIPDGTTCIYPFAFVGNSSTKILSIPSSVTKLHEYSIGSCIGLTELYCYATTPPATPDTASPFADFYATTNTITSQCTLYVPEESIDDYKSAVYWKEFINIKPIK